MNRALVKLCTVPLKIAGVDIAPIVFDDEHQYYLLKCLVRRDINDKMSNIAESRVHPQKSHLRAYTILKPSTQRSAKQHKIIISPSDTGQWHWMKRNKTNNTHV